MSKVQMLRELWEGRGNKNLSLQKRPKSDRNISTTCEELKTIDERYQNVIERYRDLAKILEMLWTMYDEKYDLYGDSILAFIGDKLVREWPWTDIPFHSKEAWNIIHNASENCNPTGLYDKEIKDNEFKNLRKKMNGNKKTELVYEHWTPMSFFRDVFVIAKEENIILTKEDILELLKRYYRVVRITSTENDKLDKSGYRSKRLTTDYKDLGIEIHEVELWDRLYNYSD